LLEGVDREAGTLAGSAGPAAVVGSAAVAVLTVAALLVVGAGDDMLVNVDRDVVGDEEPEAGLGAEASGVLAATMALLGVGTLTEVLITGVESSKEAPIESPLEKDALAGGALSGTLAGSLAGGALVGALV
jgi:hypothetical protein